MSIVLVLSLGQLANSNQEESIQAFADLCKCRTQWIRWCLLKDHYYHGTIAQYKSGKINAGDFKKKICKQLGYPNLEDIPFWNAWKAMCKLSSKQLGELQALAQLQERFGFEIILISQTNRIQRNYIHSQLQKSAITLRCAEVLSYEQKKLDFNVLAGIGLQTVDVVTNTVISVHRNVQQWQPKYARFRYVPCNNSKQSLSQVIQEFLSQLAPTLLQMPLAEESKRFTPTHSLHTPSTHHSEHELALTNTPSITASSTPEEEKGTSSPKTPENRSPTPTP